ncbi:pre-peptidase C-terminal domain-containing protein [Prosthecobacter debontii]|uniref:Pre-peptidase C-terminal domain-containing protein n=1 Tax=Prosthecobacter debontii TaxID=48467 RepID=A0A1T4WKY9_9BACT|nr:PPC domain-containing protein [Prosthecobacter debontii]SKA77849.1 pre-peptidase C-terminal domain-containing protein [Prosthecobacter debontii]
MNLRSLATLLSMSLLGAASVHAAYPEFNTLKPNGAQRGSEVKLTLTGNRLNDFESLIFFSPGFTQKSVEKVENNKVEVTVAVAPNVELGNHLFRVRTRSGVSHGRQFFVGPYPNVEDKEPNSQIDTAQTIEMNQTIEGLITSEDVDYYKVTVKKGQRISLEVDGLRLGYTVFDPYVAILDKDRFEKAFSDDTILHRQDGYCSYVADYDGDYYIMVRDSSYRGGNTSFYRLHVGSFRRSDVVYPAGGALGSTTKVRFIDAAGSFEEDVKLPDVEDPNFALFSKGAEAAPSGNPFRLVPYGNSLEVEPNNDFKSATVVTTGEPVALNGIIETPGDVDVFKIALKKDQQVVLQAYAQSLGSPLDSVIIIYNEKGGNVGSNDDGGGRRRLDSKQVFKVPADGNYFVRVSDHLERGGPNYVYRIEMVASQPELTFASPHYSVNDSHYRQFIAIPRGGRMALLENFSRSNVGGDFKFEAPGMPQGVKLLTDVAPKDQPGMPLVFEAAPDAPLGHATVPVKLTALDPNVKVVGQMRQEFDVVRQGNVVYLTEFQDKLPVAVVEEAPYSLEIEKPKVPLVNVGLLNLRVVAKRKEGFKAPIRVLMVWKPNGISTLGEQTIPEGQNECTFVLDASGNVPAGTWNFVVMGEADAGNGRIYNASPFCEVTTTPAYVNAPAIPLVAVEQGQETIMVAKMENLKPFEGEAVASIVGVPETIPIETAKITKDTKEVAFKVKTTDKSPVGKQANLFVRVEIPVEGGTTTHRVALGSTLRIDAPRKVVAKPAVVAENKPKEAPKAAAAPPKPLSRLEQLRMEAAGGK